MTEREELQASLVKSGVPAHIHDALIGYVVDHAHVGGFLQAVLSNNLFRSFAEADDENLAHLFDILKWVFNEAPGNCWGSPDTVRAWLVQRPVAAEAHE